MRGLKLRSEHHVDYVYAAGIIDRVEGRFNYSSADFSGFTPAKLKDYVDRTNSLLRDIARAIATGNTLSSPYQQMWVWGHADKLRGELMAVRAQLESMLDKNKN